jgi:hypothetical protein
LLAPLLLALGGCSGGGSGGGPAPPTVTISASATTVNEGESVELTWSSTGAASCDASGGWSGNQATSGSATSPPVIARTEFSLSCTGAGGTSEASATVTVMVTISGNINYGRIPHGGVGTGLDYSEQEFTAMTAEVLVEAIDATTQDVLASGRFAGSYQLSVPSQPQSALRVTAEMSRQDPLPLPHWQVVVRDLDDDGTPLGPVHAYTTPPFDSGAGGTHHVNIPSGWSNSGQLTGPRDAAPFAVLEAIVQGIDLVLEADPTADFPDLTIDWGPENVGGATFFSTDLDGSNPRIVLSAEPDVDTDEYDPHVILHEFGHYIEYAFSRSDSFGGPHGFGDLLDMRVAFSEGLATALGAIALGDSVYRDSFGAAQANDSFFDIEFDEHLAEGWYSEDSTWELVWDLYDGATDPEAVSLGFAPIWQVLKGPQRDTDAMTSIFSFATAIKEASPGDAPAIAALLSNEQVEGPTIDIFGSTETNDADSPDVLPVYTPIQLGQTRQVRSTNEFGTINKLSNDRFLLFSLAAPANVRFRVSADAGRDADIRIFRSGIFVGPDDLGPADEDFTLSLEAGDYVLDVYDCGNADCNDDVPPAPTDISVTVSAN